MATIESHRPPKLAPLIILLVGLPCVGACLEVMRLENFIMNESFMVGLIIGQGAFAAVLAGAMGRAWVASFLLTSLWFLIVPLVAVLWDNASDLRRLADEVMWIVAGTPPLVFCGSLPFLMVRTISGYRCTRKPQPAGLDGSISMEDFFVTTGVIAALLVTIPAAAKALNNTDTLTAVVIFGSVVFACSLFIVMPITITYLTIQKPALRLLILAVMSIGVPFLCIYGLWLSGQLRLSGTTFVEEFAPTLVTAAGYLAMCLVVLRATGFRWAKPNQCAYPLNENALAPVRNDEDTPPGHNQVRIQNRLAAVAFLLASFLQVAVYGAIGQQRQALEARLTQISTHWSELGGKLGRERHRVHTLEAPRQARAADLEYLIRFNDLYTIEAPGTAVADEMLAQVGSLQNLESIDFSHTSISDQGLQSLYAAKNLRSIKLAHSRVTALSLRRLLANVEGRVLDISGLNLTDADLATLPLKNLVRLSVRHNPVTRRSLPRLGHADFVDLGYTNLDAADLSPLSDVQHLLLDYTSINDLQLQEFLISQPRVKNLSLRGTHITDASLAYLPELTSLELSDCDVTAEGLREFGLGPLQHLALNDPKFNGSVFADRYWEVNSLDLRESSISDVDLHWLSNVAQLSILDLHGCDISDASLPFLASLSLGVLDISDTKITAAGAQQFLSCHAIYVSPSQWTSANPAQTGQLIVGQLHGELP